MRFVLVVMAVAAIAQPALARSPARPLPPEARIAERVNDPVVQDRATVALTAALGALLDLRIGAIEQAVDPRRHADPNETLRDRVARDDPYFEARLADDARRAAAIAGAAADQVAVLMPQLRAMAAVLGQRIDDVERRFPDRYPDRRDDRRLPPPSRGDDGAGEDW